MRIGWTATISGANAVDIKEAAQAAWDDFCGGDGDDLPYFHDRDKSKAPLRYRSHIEVNVDASVATGSGKILSYEGTARGWVEL